MNALELVQAALPVPASVLPQIIQAPRRATPDDLIELLRCERHQLARALMRTGAILLRGYGATEPSTLARIIEAAGGQAMRYVGGDSPRTRLDGDVYTSTETPASVPIPLHHEMSYLRGYPLQLWMTCTTPAATGGQTLLADARAIFRDIDPAVRRRFMAHGVRYICSLRGESPFFDRIDRIQKVTKTWMETFETQDRAVAERRCAKLATEHRWLPSGRLVFESLRPAVLQHPLTGESVWFNQAHLFRLNPYFLGRLHYWAARLFFLRPETRSHHACFGDGSEITNDILAHLRDVMQAHTVEVAWKRGDVLWIDNLSCMHGRNPFSGERKVLVSMTGGP